MANTSNNILKIGRALNPLERMKNLTRYNRKMRLLGYEQARPARELEIHFQFAKYRLAGEWFRDVFEIRQFALNLKCGPCPIFLDRGPWVKQSERDIEHNAILNARFQQELDEVVAEGRSYLAQHSQPLSWFPQALQFLQLLPK